MPVALGSGTETRPLPGAVCVRYSSLIDKRLAVVSKRPGAPPQAGSSEVGGAGQGGVGEWVAGSSLMAHDCEL